MSQRRCAARRGGAGSRLNKFGGRRAGMREAGGGGAPCDWRARRCPTVARPRAPSPHTFFRTIKVVSNILECCLVTFHRRAEGSDNQLPVFGYVKAFEPQMPYSLQHCDRCPLRESILWSVPHRSATAQINIMHPGNPRVNFTQLLAPSICFVKPM